MKIITLKSIEDLKLIPKNEILNAIIRTKDGMKDKRRIVNEGQSLFVLEKGSKIWGERRYSWNEKWDCIEVKIKDEEDKKKKWEKSLKRALEMLKESGLWADIKEDIETVLAIGYEKVKKALEIEDLPSIEGESYNEWKERIKREKSKIDERLEKINLWHLGYPLKIKKMYFGRGNEHIFAEIALALKNKKEYDTGRIRTNYDVSFSYNPEMGRAWYSEEYKNCGNGHYYLALNGTHAVFWEDD